MALVDITISVADRPGTGARVSRLLADAGINIEGVCAFPLRGTTWTVVHFLVPDGDGARKILSDGGVEVREVREVLVLEGHQDQPGVLADLLEDFGQRGVNIDLIYVATNDRIVIGTDDMHEAREGIRMIDARYG